MATETLKEKVERLEQEVQKLNSEKLKAWEDLAQKDIEIGSLKLKVNKLEKINGLAEHETLIEELSKDLKKLRLENAELKKMKGIKVHNERGAGRKPIMTYKQKQQIKADRQNGMTIKLLSEKYGFSVGAIHKLISE
jgi:hypothetical protein